MPDFSRKNITNEQIYDAVKQIEATLLEKLGGNGELIAELRRENDTLKRRLESLEVATRKNNIIIFGIPNSEHGNQNLCEFVVRKLKQLLDVDLGSDSISDSYTIGRGPSPSYPIKVEFVRFSDKQKVLKKVNALRGGRVFISRDLTPKEQIESRILRQHLKLAREKKVNAYIKQGKLYVNGDAYTAAELQSSTEEAIGDVVANVKSNSAPPTPVRETYRDTTAAKKDGDSSDSSINTQAGSLLPPSTTPSLAHASLLRESIAKVQEQKQKPVTRSDLGNRKAHTPPISRSDTKTGARPKQQADK